MEIERKFLPLMDQLPFCPEDYPCRQIEQGYLCTEPVVRIRKDNDDYFLTYKSKGLMVREEYNLPLTADSYAHLRAKADGRIITKKRYVIPLENNLKLELDIFEGDLAPLVIAEIEFPDEETACAAVQHIGISCVKFFHSVYIAVLAHSHACRTFKIFPQMALGRETEISGYLAVGIPGVDQEVLRQVDLLPADVLCQSDFLTLVEQL